MVEIVYPRHIALDETFKMKWIKFAPPRLDWSKYVSLLSLYGMCIRLRGRLACSTNRITTLPSALNDLLMWIAYCITSPVALEFINRYEPAKSIKLSCACRPGNDGSSHCMLIINIMWLREESRFISVDEVDRMADAS